MQGRLLGFSAQLVCEVEADKGRFGSGRICCEFLLTAKVNRGGLLGFSTQLVHEIEEDKGRLETVGCAASFC